MQESYRTKNGTISKKAIREVAQRIAENFEVEKILLFGSYAYGKPKRHSDIDLLVVMNYQMRPLKQGLEILRSLYPLHFGIDLIVKSEDDILRRIPQGDSFLRDAYYKGKVLYERNS
jgi:predicted nucleotidyltransferase